MAPAACAFALVPSVPLSVTTRQTRRFCLAKFLILRDPRRYGLLLILAPENAASAKFGPLRALPVTEYLPRRPGIATPRCVTWVHSALRVARSRSSLPARNYRSVYPDC